MKKHYKLYKSGKKWCVASIFTLIAGLGLITSTVNADSEVAKTNGNDNSEVISSNTNTGVKLVNNTVSTTTGSEQTNVNSDNSNEQLTNNNSDNNTTATATATVQVKTAANVANGWNSNNTVFYQNGSPANGYVQATDGNYYMFKDGVRQSGV